MKELIENSIAAQATKIEVFIRDGGVHLIKVKDNGYGIEKNSLKRVFERFYRSAKARAHTKGTGLGLALVKQLSTRIGANVSVESKINVGTEFFVSFQYK